MSVNVALSVMLASYASNAKVEPIKPAVKSKATIVPSAKVEPVKVETAPSDNGTKKVNVMTVPLPPKGSLSARQFLDIVVGSNVDWIKEGDQFPRVICHGQNVDREAPRFCTKPGVDRDQVIAAIAGYCGWDPTRLFGEQEIAARLKAQREIHPRPMLPRPSLTVAGLVAGMPDFRQKAIEDLKGRERCAVDGMLAFSKVDSLVHFRKAVENHCDPEMAPLLLASATEENYRELAAGCVADEQGRLAEARKGLSAYFG